MPIPSLQHLLWRGLWLLAAGLCLLPKPSAAQNVHAVTETSVFVQIIDGKAAGPATEITEKTLQLAGLKDYHISVYPWARAYEIAQNEPNVLIYLLARTPEREPLFQWVGEFSQIRYSLYKLRARTEVNGSTMAAARNQTVGVMREDLRHQYLRKQGFTRLVVSSVSSENFSQLMNSKVDLIPMSDAGAANLCREFKVDCNTVLEKQLTLDDLNIGLYMAYSKGTAPEVVRRTATAFEHLRANGTVRKLMDSAPSR
ncbi:substrate-binding periplasmic protein [Variovorax sp. HJSM1_2]|uniref:substrate-binding periplasmic protein n=1 Tax=Variovorax sp. HJSM1_2 TaxID=3366263 RepID=UPI003BE0CC5B